MVVLNKEIPKNIAMTKIGTQFFLRISTKQFKSKKQTRHLKRKRETTLKVGTGWGSEIRKKRMMIGIPDLYLRNYIKIEYFMIIFMLGYPFLTSFFNLSVLTRVRL